jgi:hypothetical protein
MTLDPGHSVRFRYRVVIHPGDYQSANIGAEYTNFSSH